jgi:hypothetical protein
LLFLLALEAGRCAAAPHPTLQLLLLLLLLCFELVCRSI